MKSFSARPLLHFFRRLTLAVVAILAIDGCSRTEVQVTAPPQPQSQPIMVTSVPNTAPSRQTAAERLVEIDRLLAMPVTGRSEESDQRALLRAERAALVDSGQVPNRMQSNFVTNHNRPVQPNPAVATVTRTTANGDVVNYAPATDQSGRTVIAPNSQTRNLSFLEQMTPTERERYNRTLRIETGDRIRVDVNHH